MSKENKVTEGVNEDKFGIEAAAKEVTSDDVKAKFIEDEKAYIASIQARRKEDPLIGVKEGSKDIFKSLMLVARDDKGVCNVHDVVLYAAGLAGYSCQAAVMETQIIRDNKKFNEVFHLVISPTGDKFIFGDAINDYLFGNKHSVWNMLSRSFKKLYPGLSVPSAAPIIKKVTANIVNPDYKVVGEHSPSELNDMYAMIWKTIYIKMRNYCPNPEEWPILYSMVLQKALAQTKGMIDPSFEMNFICEAAVFASKADLGSRMQPNE